MSGLMKILTYFRGWNGHVPVFLLNLKKIFRVPNGDGVIAAEGDADAAGAHNVCHGGGERRVEPGDGRKVPRAAHDFLVILKGGRGY